MSETLLVLGCLFVGPAFLVGYLAGCREGNRALKQAQGHHPWHLWQFMLERGISVTHEKGTKSWRATYPRELAAYSRSPLGAITRVHRSVGN